MTEPESSGVLRLRDLEATVGRAEFVHPGSRLLRRRRLTALAVVIVVGGSVGFSAAYAMYLHSGFYRRSLAAHISDRLGLVVEMSDVQRLGFSGIELFDTRVSFGGGPQVFQCRSASWRFADDGLTHGFVLDLVDGWVAVGGEGWSRSRYGELLHHSLGQDFSALHLGQIRLRDVDVRFSSPLGEWVASKTHGVVDVRSSGEAVAALSSSELNGVTVAQSVSISARFTPGSDLSFSEVRLTVPRAPIAALGLAEPATAERPHGTFVGTIRYAQDDRGDEVSVTGAITDADLAALTKLPGGPYRGRVTLDLTEARLTARKLEFLRASGSINDFFVADLFPSLAADTGSATLSLAVDDVRIRNGRIEYLKASGRCEGLSLEALTGLIGPGRVTGQVRIDIANLVIVDDEIIAADLLVDAVKPEDAPGTIDRAVLARAAKAWLGVDVGMWLPPSMEYERFGVRIVITRDGLRVEGSHGPGYRTILTVLVFGRPLAVLAAPDRTFPVPDILSLLLDRARDIGKDDLQGWWDVVHPQREDAASRRGSTE